MHKICTLLRFLLFVHVEWGTFGVGDGVGGVEGCQVYLVVADAGACGHDGTQQIAVWSWKEGWRWELVPTSQFAVVAYLPDKLGGGLATKP